MPCHNRITVLRHRVGAPLAMRKPRRRPSRVTKASLILTRWENGHGHMAMAIWVLPIGRLVGLGQY